MAAMYLDAGFTVVYQDILIGDGLATAVERLRGHPLSIVVLCPSPDAVAAREAARPKSGYRDAAEIAAFDRILRTETPRIGLWLDSSAWTADETVDRILTDLERARVA